MALRANTFPALACRVSVMFSAGIDAIRRVLKMEMLPYQTTGGQWFDVLVNEDFARFTGTGPDERPLWTIVRQAESRAASVWDHEARTVVDLSHDAVKPVAVTRAAGLDFRVRSSRSRDKDNVAEIIIQDPAVGTFRQVLTFTKRPELARYGPALLRLLFGGPACHANSGLPLERLERLGCLTAAATLVGNSAAPIIRLSIEAPHVAKARYADFRPPRGFVASDPAPARANKHQTPAPTAPASSVVPPAPTPMPPAPTPVPGAPPGPVSVVRSFTAAEAFTPDCFGTTRFGSMAVLLHQDALDDARRAVNPVAPLLGTATLSGGTLTLDWLGALKIILMGTGMPGTGSATAPGSGLFCALENPRMKPTATKPASGGDGLFDQIAVRNLVAPDKVTNQSFLQSQAASGALLNTMLSWGLGNNTALIARLFAVGGDLRSMNLSTSDRIEIADAYEKSLGMLSLDLLPSEVDFDVPNVVHAHLFSLTGAMNFGSLGTTLLVPGAAIGSTGNITIVLNVPTTTLNATATWQISPYLAAAVLIVSVITCIFFPFACAAVATVVTILTNYVTKQLAVISGVATGVSLSVEVAYRWDPTRGVVSPFVSSQLGSGAVTVFASTPPSNPIRQQVEQILITAGDALGIWTRALTAVIPQKVQSALRDNGFECPLGAQRLKLSAASGGR
jgi:hypothetical protein